ncbi:MAG: aminotransferase class V-fold PLP-dependent enzyme [Myxococcales bacterium]|nr:aminotransferase class V-fold PLP-dependent enzyme [Myxococcales bacterium]
MENGRVAKVEARDDSALGMICKIGERSPEIIYDPDRIKTPLKRVGPKGSHDFEPIGWNEAFDMIEANFKAFKEESGPESTAIYTGRGGFELSLCDIFQPADVAVSSASSVLFPFGSPNTMGVGALCYVSFAMIAPHVTFGEMYISLQMDVEAAETIVIWGANPATDSPPLLHHEILEAKKRGARIVTIDPRYGETAAQTQAQWISPRPGTDGALALGMIQVLIEEELYDEEFAENWCEGFEDLATYAQHFHPQAVEAITGVPADTIRELSRLIAGSRGAVPVMYTGLEYSDSGVQAIRAVFILWALAGQLDVPGGLNIRMKENQFPVNRQGLVANPDVRNSLGRDRFPLYTHYRGESHATALPESVLRGNPYKVRGLIILGGSIITSWPQPKVWKETLGALDFLVCVDRYLTADSAYADLVLPATTMYEIESYMVYGSMFCLREKLVEPQGEARDDFHVLAELARRLGYGERYPQSDQARLEHILKGSGFTPNEVRMAGGTVRIETVMTQYKKWQKGLLRPDGKVGFDTPSGKFEIVSSILEEHGYEGLPVYTEPGEGPLAQPEAAERYPLVFNSGARIYADFRSQHHGVEGLKQMARDPMVTLNTKDAAKRDIKSGDWVWVETIRGKVKFKANVTDNIVQGAIDANMGGGGPLGSETWKNGNVNELTDLKRFDPISGFPVYKSLLCQVSLSEAASAVGLAEDESVRPNMDSRDSHELKPMEVYLDHNATKPVAPEVFEAMVPFLQEISGNPSSIHACGVISKDAVEAARRKVAALIHCTARRVVFTGGGSESDNLAIKGVALARMTEGKHIVTTSLEHPAVLGACEGLSELGFRTTVVAANEDGTVDPIAVERAITCETTLVSMMFVNNELGTIQPIRDVADICRAKGVLFHTDAVQALGKLMVDVDELGVDLLSVSAHKLGGPKGVGALYIRKGVKLHALIQGGAQENRLRAGTENVAGIAGFGRACELAQIGLNAGTASGVAELRDRLERGLCQLIPGAFVNGTREHRTANTTNLVLPGMRGESLVLALSRHGVYFSSGSACKSGNPAPSHVLKAIGLSDEHAHCSVRFSLDETTTPGDIDYALAAFKKMAEKSKNAIRFVGCR